MSDAPASESKATSRAPGSAGDRAEVIKVLALAVFSFLAGFGLVFLFLSPSSGGDVEHPEQQGESGHEPQTAAVFEEPAAEHPPADDPAPRDEGDAPPEVPPGRTPDGVVLDGNAFVLRCWNHDGVELDGDDCDRLDTLEKRFSTRLYVVDECRRQAAGESASGRMSVASEVDFQKMTISFWSGASSDIREAAAIGTCLRERLAGLPLGAIDNEHARYRLFFNVLFGDAAEKRQKAEAARAAAFVAGKGRLVDVTKDRVRVRTGPVDGDIIGRISTGRQVRLLKQERDWCRIITPNNNEGWMICDALDL